MALSCFRDTVSPQSRTVEEKIAWIASRAHGLVTWEELRRAGITAAQIKYRLRTGALIRTEYRGVYRVGHQAPSVEATYLAAVKACGPGALLCGAPAAHLYRILKCRRPPPPEVMAPTERHAAKRRARRIDKLDATRYRGIPVTTIPRTIVDLAAELEPEQLARVCHEADVLHGIRPEHVEAVLARRANAPGAGRLRWVLNGDVPVLLSELERGFSGRLRAERFPLPETNRRVDERYVDCRWRVYKLTVELKGYAYHRTRHAWEQDHLREREARGRGDRFRSYTYRDVFEDPEDMLRELSELLPRL